MLHNPEECLKQILPMEDLPDCLCAINNTYQKAKSASSFVIFSFSSSLSPGQMEPDFKNRCPQGLHPAAFLHTCSKKHKLSLGHSHATGK